MNNLSTLNENAHIAVTPYEAAPKVRIEAATRYPLPLQELYLYQTDVIISTLTKYNQHLGWFMGAIEDRRENAAVKISLLQSSIEHGLSSIAASAFVQKNWQYRPAAPISEPVPLREYLMFHYVLAANPERSNEHNVIIEQVKNTFDFDALLERLCKIVENEDHAIPVRDQAIKTMHSTYTQGVQSFNLHIDRKKFAERVLIAGLTSPDLRLKYSAIQFAYGTNFILPRNPSQPSSGLA